MLIADNGEDLQYAQHDARLVRQAVLRCRLCSQDRVVDLFNQTAVRLKEALRDLIGSRMKSNDKVLLWYSGHGHEENGETLVLGKTEKDSEDDSLKSTDSLWLEDTLFGLTEDHRGLTICCVVAACRTRDKPRSTLNHGFVELPRFDRLPSLDNCYAFWYSCAAREAMLDSSIFAMSFCYHLESEPQSLQGLGALVNKECKWLTFGDIVSAIEYYGQDNEVFLHTKKTLTPTRIDCNKSWIDTLQRDRLVANHLHVLAVDHIFDSDRSDPENLDDSDSEKVEGSDLDPYGPYVDVKIAAAEIMEAYYNQAHRFQDLSEQLRILACSSLSEVKSKLLSPVESQQSQAASSSGREWRPDDKSLGCEDTRVVLNLPDQVVHIIGEVVRRWRTKLPTDAVTKMLQMLGCYYTKKSFEDFELEIYDGESVQEYLEYYFRIPRALLKFWVANILEYFKALHTPFMGLSK